MHNCRRAATTLISSAFSRPPLPDVHRVGSGLRQSLQGAGDLHQAAHGAIPRSQLLRGLPAHVSRALRPRPRFAVRVLRLFVFTWLPGSVGAAVGCTGILSIALL